MNGQERKYPAVLSGTQYSVNIVTLYVDLIDINAKIIRKSKSCML